MLDAARPRSSGMAPIQTSAYESASRWLSLFIAADTLFSKLTSAAIHDNFRFPQASKLDQSQDLYVAPLRRMSASCVRELQFCLSLR